MANTTNYNWETPDDTDLVKDGAAAIRTLGNSIDTTTKNLNPETTTGDIAYRSATANTNTRLAIGSAGQVLTVAAGVPSWATPNVGDITEVQAGVGISVASGTGPIPVITNSSTDLITTAGDILYGTAADTVARLGIGTAGQVLKVNSGATAPEWGAASATSGPAFSVYKASNQTLTLSTFTKVTWSNEEFDTASNFASDRFTPTTAGYYQINATLNIDLSGGSGTIQGRLYKNGANYCELFRQNTNYGTGSGSTIVYMNGSSDYLEIYAQGNAGTVVVFGGSTLTQFNGVWIRS